MQSAQSAADDVFDAHAESQLPAGGEGQYDADDEVGALLDQVEAFVDNFSALLDKVEQLVHQLTITQVEKNGVAKLACCPPLYTAVHVRFAMAGEAVFEFAAPTLKNQKLS